MQRKTRVGIVDDFEAKHDTVQSISYGLMTPPILAFFFPGVHLAVSRDLGESQPCTLSVRHLFLNCDTDKTCSFGVAGRFSL